MRRHVVAYVQTSKLTDWKRLALHHSRRAGHPVFVYRSDDDRVFARYAKAGAVLWVIESHPSRPPSLAARLDITGQVHGRLEIDVVETSGRSTVSPELLRSFEYGRKLRWYAVGSARRSRFYGLNDISPALLATRLEGGQRWEPGAMRWRSEFGRTFLRPRLVAEGAACLVAAAERLETRSVFLSWKHRDFEGSAGERVVELVEALVAEGLDCWWDRRALPSSPALERLRRHPDLLGRMLDDGLRRARYLLALGSPAYGEPSASSSARNWTAAEWDTAGSRLVWAHWGTPRTGWPAGEYTLLRQRTARTVARAIAATIDGDAGADG